MRMPLECVTPRSARMRSMKSKLTAGVAVLATLLASCATDFGAREREPRPPAPVAPGADWTRTEPVRDDPGTLGEEARKLWDSVREQFVDPLVRNYPEAAGHLTTAGTELAAALRALVRGAEQRWTNGGEERPDDGRDSPQDKRP